MKLDLQLIPLGVCATAPIPSYNCYQTGTVLENNKFSFKYLLGPRQKASPKQQLKSYSFPSHFITVDYRQHYCSPFCMERVPNFTC